MSISIQNNQLRADLTQLVQRQRDFFQGGTTLDLSFRIKQLEKLRQAVVKYRFEILNALYADLHKSETEAELSELTVFLNEVEHLIKTTPKLARRRRVGTPLALALASSYVQPEPYGNTLIIAPWNYPFQLLFVPLAGAIAAGNTAIVKPSELSANVSDVCKKIIDEIFDPAFVALVQGGVEETTAVLEQRFDYIFYTGSTQVGKIVYQAAAKHLTPVTLELGGKSPCIVDADTHLEYTARRIVWGKFINCGQTCIAPDYILVNKKIKKALIAKIKEKILEFYGENPAKSDDYGRIINARHFERLEKLINPEKVIFGGKTNSADRYMAPTLMDEVTVEDAVMQEEIFGPILPIISYDEIEQAIQFIKDGEKPLALYVFSKNNALIDQVLKNTSSGGVCINDTALHFGNGNLPFGGVGESGIGSYHGKHTFNNFSHSKGVLHKSFLLDFAIRYAPFKGSKGKNLIKLFRWFG